MGLKVIAALKNFYLLSGTAARYSINKAIFTGNAARPQPPKGIFRGLRFPEPPKRIALYVFDSGLFRAVPVRASWGVYCPA
jgi:hypothetical protein